MKSFYIFLSILFCLESKSQLSVNVISILTNSNRFTYVGFEYKPDIHLFQPDYNLLNNVLGALNERYEMGHALCKHEYDKLRGLSLININNKRILEKHRKEIEEWADREYRKIDLSIESNKNSVVNYITSVYKIQSIRDEIEILKACSILYESVNASTVINAKCKIETFELIDAFLREVETYTAADLRKGMNSLFPEYSKRRGAQYAKRSDERRNKILASYEMLPYYKFVTTGWHDAKLISVNKIERFGASYYDVIETKIYVENLRVKMISKSDGSAYETNSNIFIKNQKVDLLLPSDKCYADDQLRNIPYTVYIM